MVRLIVNSAFVVNEINCSETLTEVEVGFLDGVRDGFRLVLHCEVEVLRVLAELVEDDDRVVSAQLGLLLELLHSGDDLPCEPAGFEGLVLARVEQDAA